MAALLRREFHDGDIDFDALMLEVVELLCLWEVYVPATEHTLQIHSLMHMVYSMKMWGSSRNYWMFPFERSPLNLVCNLIPLHVYLVIWGTWHARSNPASIRRLTWRRCMPSASTRHMQTPLLGCVRICLRPLRRQRLVWSSACAQAQLEWRLFRVWSFRLRYRLVLMYLGLDAETRCLSSTRHLLNEPRCIERVRWLSETQYIYVTGMRSAELW